MSRTRRTIFCMSLLAALALTTSCKFTGGGWLFAPGGTGKATFGFSGVCDPRTERFKGQGDYADKVNKVYAHLVAASDSCDPDSSNSSGTHDGTYTPQPKTLGPGGTFEISVTDSGEPGPSAGDFFSISFQGGVHSNYSNSGTIQGGNIQIK